MAELQLVHRRNNTGRRRLHRERMFRDRSHPFKIDEDAKLFTRYRFRRADIMDIDDVVGDSVLVAERKCSVTPTLALRCR